LSSVGGQFKKKEGHAYGVAGVTKGTLKVGEIDAFEVGSYKAGSHPVGAMDFSYQPRPALGTSMDGLLGIDFLHRHQAVIDCFQMNLFLKSPTAPSSSAALSAGLKAGGCTEIPLHIAPTGLAVSTTIDGRSGYLIVDTGSPFTLFREHAIAELGMRRTSISARSRLQMIDVGKNTAQVQMVYFKTMDIGGFNVPSQGVGVADVPMLKGGGPGGVFFGYLGQDLLAYYVAIIDCHALKLYLRLDPAIEAERKKRNG
jgi:hypothetical protein